MQKVIRVRIKKVHPSWNTLYTNEFVVGDEADLEFKIEGAASLITKNGNRFNPMDLTRSYSNICSFADIFEKI